MVNKGEGGVGMVLVVMSSVIYPVVDSFGLSAAPMRCSSGFGSCYSERSTVLGAQSMGGSRARLSFGEPRCLIHTAEQHRMGACCGLRVAWSCRGDGSQLLLRAVEDNGDPESDEPQPYVWNENRLPEDPESTLCACGSGNSYADCCRPFHRREVPILVPSDLAKARYSAFAYAQTGFLMSTTAPTSPDWRRNRVEWAAELIDFCALYKFYAANGDPLGIEIENCRVLDDRDIAYVQFKARMLGPGDRLVEFVERSRIDRVKNKWYYFSGKLMEYQGPLI